MRSVAILALPLLASSAVIVAADRVPTLGAYEPNPARVFGEPNPNAPIELAQFGFLVGEHRCSDELTDLDGKTTRLVARWSGRYILNGYGIQDSYWNDSFSTTNVRIYDEARARWQVTYFRQPDYQSGVWEGSVEESGLILKRAFERDGRTVESLLTFSDITESGFNWTAEYVSGDARYTHWTSTCRRSPAE